MTPGDFIDFCKKAGIIDTSALGEYEVNALTQEYDLLYVTVTSRRENSVSFLRNSGSVLWTDWLLMMHSNALRLRNSLEIDLIVLKYRSLHLIRRSRSYLSISSEGS